jgi:hypothetical protein
MTLTLTLTDKIRSFPYFSSFTEDEVEVPDRPFLLQLLEGSLRPEELSASELFSCLETCIYFSLETVKIVPEFFWKIGETEELFDKYFVPDFFQGQNHARKSGCPDRIFRSSLS